MQRSPEPLDPLGVRARIKAHSWAGGYVDQAAKFYEKHVLESGAR
jgi:hypothetical protein